MSMKILISRENIYLIFCSLPCSVMLLLAITAAHCQSSAPWVEMWGFTEDKFFVWISLLFFFLSWLRILKLWLTIWVRSILPASQIVFQKWNYTWLKNRKTAKAPLKQSAPCTRWLLLCSVSDFCGIWSALSVSVLFQQLHTCHVSPVCSPIWRASAAIKGLQMEPV